MNSDKDNIIDVDDYRGKRVIFTRKKWKEKSKIHLELLSKTFLRNVRKTIAEPEEVWQDFENKKCKRCYYKKYSVHSYVKVVIWVKHNPHQIITAFQINYIKETKYPQSKKII